MTTSNFNIVKETEKAVNVEIAVVVGGRGKEIMWKFWLPKSQIKIENNTLEAPQWLMGKKSFEINGFVAFA